ncbi:TonB-dependent copper receptor [Mixta mediterraneensis]|uniref:TonB-dependent copper receptor n=1 Tax=Mixta mediterraneensis TaxID=2758443 RepID=UPI0019342B47|nr:TonB-dependent copper receptor [Mixta mediterraneensis]
MDHCSQRRQQTMLRHSLLAACCIAATSAHAEQVMTVTAPQKNPGVVVTSTQTPRQPVPASDGADLLKTIPGFSVLRSGGSNGDPVLRGMFGSRLNILANGASTQGGCGSRMDTPTAYITPKNYDLLTVVKGPQTVLWGPMASAGTLLFERQPELFSEPGIKGSATVLRGANGRADENLNTVFGNQQGYVRIDGSRSVANDYADGNGDRVPSLWRKWSGELTAGLTPDDDTLIEMSVGASDGKARYAGRGMDGSRFLRKDAALKIEKYDLSDHISKVSWQSYYNDTDHVMDNFRLRKPTGMKMETEVGSVTYGTRLSAVLEKDTTQLTSGIDAQRKMHRKKAGSGWQEDAAISQLGMFSEWRESLSENATSIVGGRLDYYQAKDERSAQQATRSAVQPGAFARYEYYFPEMPLMAYSGIGYTERFPDYWELFSGKAGQSSFHHLKSEKTLQWDNGLQLRTDNLNLWASAYVGRVQDYILFDYRNTPSQARNIDATTMGGEVGGTLAFYSNWSVDSSLSYSWGQNRDDNKPLPQMPPLEARLGLNYLGSNWGTTLLWRVVASQHRIAQDQGNVTGKDLGNSAGFGILSWSADYRFTKDLNMSIGIDNLLNKQYSEHLNMAGNKQFGYAATERIPEPGRTWWLSGTYHF